MKSSKLRWPVVLGLALVFGASVSAAETASPAGAAVAEPAADDVGQRQRAALDAKFKAQDERIAEAEKLRASGDYERAIKALENVLGELELESGAIRADVLASRRDEVGRKLWAVRGEYGSKVLTQARMAAAEKRYEDAKNMAGGVGAIDPRLKAKADELAGYCNDMIKNAELETTLSLQNTLPEREAKLKRVSQLLNEAKTFYAAKRYGEALNRIEDAYIVDPYNIDVIAFAGRVYQQIYAYGYHRHQADIEGVVGYVPWQWVEPVFMRAQTIDNTAPGLVRDSTTHNVEDNLDRLIIKRINFEDADIRTVIKTLSTMSADVDPERKGVDINLILTQDQADEMPPLTFDFSNIAMSDLLRYISRMTNLKYRGEADGSVVMGVEVNDMLRKNFVVRGNLIKNVVDESGTATVAPTPVDEPAPEEVDPEAVANKSLSATTSGVDTKGRVIASPADLKAYFIRRNVSFPEGSSISYNPGRRELVVRNTARNLQKLERLINQYDMLSKLIMVEIKVIEITESDLQELGFHWSLNMLGSNMNSDGNLIDSTKNGWGLGQGANTSSVANSTAMLQSIREGVTGVNSTVVSDLNIIPMLFGSTNPFGSDSALNIGLTINALSQNTRTEVLSSPKLITMDGQTASIEMIRRYYFPVSWDTMEVETETSDNSSQVTITPPVPTFSEGGDPIGIMFTVTPKVLDDGHTINMHVNPVITSYIGPDNWTIKIYGYIPGGYSIINGVLTQNEDQEYDYVFTIWRPIISRRQLDVNVNVYDGQTIVLGGVVESLNTGRTDKLPILGDLPLIGRFFQSQSDNLTRTNLLIFVTARLMKNDGVPINPSMTTGSPDFNR